LLKQHHRHHCCSCFVLEKPKKVTHLSHKMLFENLEFRFEFKKRDIKI